MRWTSSKAVALLEEVLPYLVVKVAQAKLILGVHSASKKFSPTEPMTVDWISAREHALAHMRRMNKKGKELAP